MKRLPIPPTRNALMQIKNQLHFLHTGHDLLERKKELLTRMVREQTQQYKSLKKKVQQSIQAAYHWLAITQLRMGERMIKQSALGLKPSLEVNIIPRSNLGIEYPAVQVRSLPLQPVSLLWNDASFDQARQKLTEMATLLTQLGESETALRRMLNEQIKTQKRVNALKYNIIPLYENTIRYISAALEEEERNHLFQIKQLNPDSNRP